MYNMYICIYIYTHVYMHTYIYIDTFRNWRSYIRFMKTRTFLNEFWIWFSKESKNHVTIIAKSYFILSWFFFQTSRVRRNKSFNLLISEQITQMIRVITLVLITLNAYIPHAYSKHFERTIIAIKTNNLWPILRRAILCS